MKHRTELGKAYVPYNDKIARIGRKMDEIYNGKHCAQNRRYLGHILGARDLMKTRVTYVYRYPIYNVLH